MRAQRVRVAESRVEMQFVKWTAEGAVKGQSSRLSILRRETYVNCRGYEVSRKVHGTAVKQGGTAGAMLSRIDSARP